MTGVQTCALPIYVVDMVEDAEHIELLEALKDHTGPVILSGYDNELYDRHLQGWMKLHKKALAEGGGKRTETVWLNYEPQVTLIGDKL